MFPECMFPLLFDFGDPFHSLDGGLYELSVVANRDVSSLLEFDGRVL